MMPTNLTFQSAKSQPKPKKLYHILDPGQVILIHSRIASTGTYLTLPHRGTGTWYGTWYCLICLPTT